MTVTLPRRGDIAWVSTEPTQGREQRGHRPHLVLSDERLGRNLGIVIAVPMTTARRPWATRVEVAEGSFAIAEQPRTFSVDRITKVEPIGYDVGPVVRVIAILLGS